MKKKQIFDEINEERKRQDEQWGGPSHDRAHSMYDWTTYIEKQLTRVKVPQSEFRERMIKIAALAVAAIEASDEE